MDLLGIFTLVSAGIGIISFVFAFVLILKIIAMFPKGASITKYWKIAISLIIFFILGYIAAIISVILEIDIINQIITPIVYVFGAVFVLIMVLLSLRTYKMIIK